MPIANIGAVPDVVTNTLIATDWGNAIGAASRGRVVQRFNSVAERDASITAPVAGMLCYVLATDLFYGYRTASGWTVLVGGPRDTYHAKVYRSAAWTLGTSPMLIPFDTIQRDPLGLWVPGSTGFVVPTVGIYLLAAGMSIAPPATGAIITLNLAVGGANVISQTLIAASTWGTGPTIAGGVAVGAGGLVQASGNAPAAVAAGQAGVAVTWMSIDYLGTG